MTISGQFDQVLDWFWVNWSTVLFCWGKPLFELANTKNEQANDWLLSYKCCRLIIISIRLQTISLLSNEVSSIRVLFFKRWSSYVNVVTVVLNAHGSAVVNVVGSSLREEKEDPQVSKFEFWSIYGPRKSGGMGSRLAQGNRKSTLHSRSLFRLNHP